MCWSRCVAEVLGIEPFDIRAVTGDTDLTPVDLGSYSSRVTLMMGNAAIQAAERARDLLADAVAEKLAVPQDRLVFADRRVFDAENPDTGVTFAEAVQLAEAKFGTIGTTGSYTPPRSAGEVQGRRRRPVADLLLLRRGRRGRGRSRRPAGFTCRTSGSRTTSAARSTRRWCAARSRAASTWRSAKR